MKNEFLRISEAAKMLGISRRTLERYVKRGIIPCYQSEFGCHRRFRQDEVAHFAAVHSITGVKAYALVSQLLTNYQYPDADGSLLQKAAWHCARGVQFFEIIEVKTIQVNGPPRRYLKCIQLGSEQVDEKQVFALLYLLAADGIPHKLFDAGGTTAFFEPPEWDVRDAVGNILDAWTQHWCAGNEMQRKQAFNQACTFICSGGNCDTDLSHHVVLTKERLLRHMGPNGVNGTEIYAHLTVALPKKVEGI